MTDSKLTTGKSIYAITIITMTLFIILLFWGSKGNVTVLLANVWVNLVFYLFITASALFFLAIHKLSSAKWYLQFEFIPLGFIDSIVVFVLMFLLFLTITKFSTGEWISGFSQLTKPDRFNFENLPGYVLSVLNLSFLFVFAVWLKLRIKKNAAKEKKFFAFYAVFYTLFLTVSSINWLMSIHKNWHSSLFPWYILSSSLTCAVAVLIIAVFIFNNRSEAKAKKTLQTLTNYLFAFSCFWAYLWFSQYLLIWYGNLPEETSFIVTIKQHYPWFMIFEIMLGFILPFLLLLSPVFRQNNKLVLISALSVFIAHLIGFYVIVFSGLFPDGHNFSVIEMILGLLFLLLFSYLIWYGVQKRNIK